MMFPEVRDYKKTFDTARVSTILSPASSALSHVAATIDPNHELDALLQEHTGATAVCTLCGITRNKMDSFSHAF